MKISKETLALLGNYAAINSNFLIREGSKQDTISATSTTVSFTTVPEDFPTEFPIYDLSEFLSVVSLFEDADLEFNDEYVEIKSGKNVFTYYAADKEVLHYVKKVPKLSDLAFEFDLTSVQLQSLLKAARAIKAERMSIIGEKGLLKMIVYPGEKRKATSQTFSIELGKTDESFSINFRLDNLKLINNDYTIRIWKTPRLISEFVSKNSDLVYYVGIEADTQYE